MCYQSEDIRFRDGEDGMFLRFAGIAYQQIGYLVTKETLPSSHTYQCGADFLAGILLKNHSETLFYAHPPDKILGQFHLRIIASGHPGSVSL